MDRVYPPVSLRPQFVYSAREVPASGVLYIGPLTDALGTNTLNSQHLQSGLFIRLGYHRKLPFPQSQQWCFQ